MIIIRKRHKREYSDKNAEIISLSSYKRLKFKKNHFKKEGHVDTNKNKIKNVEILRKTKVLI